MALTFTACSSDKDEPAPQPAAPELHAPTYADNSVILEFSDKAISPFKEMIFTEGSRALILPFPHRSDFVRLNHSTNNSEYMVGTFSLQNNVYTVYNSAGQEYCSVKVESKGSGQTNVTIRLTGQPEVQTTATATSGANAPKASEIIGRSWEIAMARLTYSGKVTGFKVFDGSEASSLNKILEYAKTHATINEQFAEDMVIEEIAITRSNSIIFFFKNGQHYVGKWKWSDSNTGRISYAWNADNMGNQFESGMAVFDVRAYRGVSYYALTLTADLEDNTRGKYNIELSFYLKEKGARR